MDIDIDSISTSLPEDLQLIVFVYALPDATHAIQSVTNSGDLQLAKWLARALEGAIIDPVAKWDVTFEACRQGNRELAQWFMTKFEQESLLAADSYRLSDLLLASCMGGGRLDIAQWLTDKFGLKTYTTLHFRGIFRDFCEYNCFEAVQWMVDTFGLPAVSPPRDVWNTFNAVCRMGHLRIAQWLLALFVGFSDRPDGAVDSKVAFRTACAYGRLETAQWLNTEFDIIPFIYDAEVLSISTDALAKGHTDIARWLLTSYMVYRREHEDCEEYDIYGEQDDHKFIMICESGTLEEVQAACRRDTSLSMGLERTTSPSEPEWSPPFAAGYSAARNRNPRPEVARWLAARCRANII